jgi:zinc protease
MRLLSRQSFTAAAVLLMSAAPSFAQVRDYREIKTPALRKLNVAQPKRIQLPNGMVIFLMEDHELPLIQGSATIRGGERDVPLDKAGLMAIGGQSWRTGGTQSKTGDELDDFLESRAARVETGGDDDSTSVSMNVLKGDFDAVFPIFLDVLQHPAFRQEKIDLARTLMNTGISRRNDEPGGIIGREASKLGYGADSPYAHQPEYATVASITRDDLLAFHNRFVHPNNMIVGFVGDFDAAQMEAKLRKTFSSWKRGPQAPAPTQAMSPAKPGIYFIPKSDVTQSNIAIVAPGTSRNNPDYYALAVMNEVIGGGFSGRLMNELRTKRGLTYGVRGGVGADWDHPGLFRVQMATKSGTTLESIDALRGEINNFVTKPFTADELSLAKESILNAFVFTMDSREKVLSQAVALEFYGFPPDYYQKYTANIEKVTAEDLSRVAKKYIHPDQVAVLVVGNEKDFDKPLSTLGSVTPIDITIPEPGASKKPAAGATAAPAGSNAEGRALLGKVVDFVGGKANIDSVRSLRTVMTASMQTPQGPMDAETDLLVRYPDAQRRIMKMPMGEVTMVISPEASFIITPMGPQDLPGSQRDAIAGEMKQELLAILKNADNPKYAFTGSGNVLTIDADGATVTWEIDPASGKVQRVVRQGRMGETVTELAEWKSFGGLTLPVGFTSTLGGQKSGSGTVKSIEVNPAVDASAFAKPAAK